MKLALKKTFIWFLRNKSIFYAENQFFYLKRFLKFIHSEQATIVSSITGHQIINYYSTLSKKNQYYLGYMSGFLKRWHEMSYPGIEDDAVAILKQFRIKGNVKGEAVLTMDPVNGPYSDLELQGILSVLKAAFQDKVISLGEYVLVWLFLALGQRPIQYSLLKVSDVGSGQSKSGSVVYTLRVPRVKQRNKLARSEFKDRLLIEHIGEKLLLHAAEVKERFKGILGDPDQAPLFPEKITRRRVPPGFEFHRTSNSLLQTLRGIIDRLHVMSERTGKPLHINAYRFRRTVGTRAAVEGHGELEIAELLDHSDTQNVGVYVEADPAIIRRIDRAVAFRLAPLAQAFAGVIIADESEAPYAGDPSHRVCDPRFDPTMKPIGSCGKHGFCGSMAPIACYTCRSFRPWLDAPHEMVLNYLIAERERLLISSDLRISSINDRTIVAVAEVVRQCQIIRDSRGDENG
ncbi:MAG: integrase [Deltaproteobacteria bacterium HGW-Deltaproteobacteria-6]|nr:MAG: integrase [Deltaproteobacteria bacterium HGW-Deltaproteobacteria-6]